MYWSAARSLKSHGGRTWASHNPGSRMTFLSHLASEGSRGVMSRGAQARGTAATTPIVFVVDDDPSVCKALSSLFRSVGLRVELFGSAAEFLQRKTPDSASCLVLDIRLPGVSGLDFQHQLLKANIRTPIIFMTGHGDIPMSVRAMKAGAVDFLAKPFRDQDMLDAVSAAIQRDQQVRESVGRCRGPAGGLRIALPARAGGDDARDLRPIEQAGRRAARA